MMMGVVFDIVVVVNAAGHAAEIKAVGGRRRRVIHWAWQEQLLTIVTTSGGICDRS
jgi:hypothetical protein